MTPEVALILGIDGILMGYALPEDNIHSPNERMKLGQLHNGAIATAAFLGNLAQEMKETAKREE